MEKPLILIQKEFRDEITETINKYIDKIPATNIVDYLNNISREMNRLAEAQYADALKKYEESLKEECPKEE